MGRHLSDYFNTMICLHGTPHFSGQVLQNSLPTDLKSNPCAEGLAHAPGSTSLSEDHENNHYTQGTFTRILGIGLYIIWSQEEM
jgi:hypothetical protein